jgi:linalool 8-monooxygenase
MAKTRRAVPIDKPDIVDLKDPDIYAENRHDELFARLRAEEPVYWNPEADGPGFWVITRYSDAARIVRDASTFSAAAENGGMRIFNIQDVGADPAVPHFLSMDPPNHTDLRRAISGAFTANKIALMEPRIRARVKGLLNAVAARGEADFVAAVAAPTTLGVLTDLLDVPETDASSLLKWSNCLVGDDDPDYQPTVEYRLQVVDELDTYAARLFSERLHRRGRDVASLMTNAKIGGRTLSLPEFSVNFAAFVIAGNETTRHAIAHGMLALTLFPAQQVALLRDPLLIDSAVKEIIRWASPLMYVRRTAMIDVEIGGKAIKAGEKVVVWYYSANRDEEKWRNPLEFDVKRFAGARTMPHISFGTGPHHCLGWRLAELQVRVVFEEVLRRFPNIRVADPIRRLRSNFISGIKELPVTFTPS